jgi:hypothetical protein
MAGSFSAAAIAALTVAGAQYFSAQVGSANNPFKQPLTTASGETQPYYQFPIQRLKEAVPAIRGIRYEASQDQLPVILAGVAKTIADVLPRLPNLTSREDIYHFQSASTGTASAGPASTQPWSREFKYLILFHHNPDGGTTIDELRTDSKGRPADSADLSTSPSGYGFANEWLFFRAANQPEFHFRYLGQQDKDGHKTFVVAFAQDPAKVTNPARYQSEGKVRVFFYQGVLWIDQSSFEIVKLRTDLLAPLSDLHLRQLTTELSFRSVPIHGYNTAFWLPTEVYIASDQGVGPTEESHRYSDYHLFHAETRIVPEP